MFLPQVRLRTASFDDSHHGVYSAFIRQKSESVCEDGKLDTHPYCGRGPCNIFGCNCDDGCIRGRHFEVKTSKVFKTLNFFNEMKWDLQFE